MIADELSQKDIDALLGGLTGGSAGGESAASGGAASPAPESDLLGALTGAGEADPAATSAAAPSPDAVNLPEFKEGPAAAESAQKLESLLSDVNIRVKIRLGKTQMLVEDILMLKPGRVVQLDRMSGDPVDVMVNDRILAKGEVIILNDAFCVRVTEIFPLQEKIERQA